MNQKVSLIRCEEYEPAKVKAALQTAIKGLGGLDKFFNPGDKVLFKVNLLMKKTPEEVTTTHPVFVAALAEIFIEFGLSVLIGDSPGGPFNESILNPVYKASGMDTVEKTTGAILNRNFAAFEKENPNGLLLKRITLTDMLNDVDKVVSLAKLKTHGMMTYTGAVKNMFGTIPGVLKAEYHLNMPERDSFANALIDICICSNPVLSFIDGIIAMEGEGPSAGSPRQMNAILASESPVHLDKAACTLINLPFKDVPTIRNCIERGLCNGDFSDIDLFGDSIDGFIVNDFAIPAAKEINPLRNSKFSFLNNYLGKLVQSKPVFHHDKCIGCAICANNCPAKIIDMQNKRPTAKLDNCIRCFCCQELCPAKAIDIHRPLLLKLFRH